MNFQEQVKRYRELACKIEELEKEKKALSVSILNQMPDKHVSLPGYFVRRCQRLSIKLTVDEAKAFNATKMEECVDKEKIKLLYQQGCQIKGVSETQFIQVLPQPPYS